MDGVDSSERSRRRRRFNNQGGEEEEEEELQRQLLPGVQSLPLSPPSAVQSNYVSYFAPGFYGFHPDFMKPGHDQFVYGHANGLYVIGLTPMHVALMDKGGVTAVDFNVGKTNRKVTENHKKNAQNFESNSALCKVCTSYASYIERCCIKGNLLEVNDKLVKEPGLLN